MRIKKRIFACFSTLTILIGSTCGVYAKSDTNTLNVKVVGGLGTAEIQTQNNVTYPIDGGDASFDFDKDTELKITIHSKYGIQNIKENNTVLKLNNKKIRNIEKKKYTFSYKTKDKDANLVIRLNELHSRFKITRLNEDEGGSTATPVQSAKFGCVKKEYYDKADRDINKAIELAKEDKNENAYQILETDDSGKLMSKDLDEGEYVIQEMDCEDENKYDDAFGFVVSQSNNKSYVYGVLSNNQISSDEKGNVNFIISNKYIQSGTRIVAKKNNKIVKVNSSFQIRMLNDNEMPKCNYSKKRLKSNQKGILSFNDGYSWLSKLNLKHGICTLPVVLPDGEYEIVHYKSDKNSPKKDIFSVRSSQISGLDKDSQAVLDVVLNLESED